MKRIIAAIVLVLFISFNICADYNPTQYNVENFDNGENQWDQTGIVDGAWWDHGHPNIYDMRISSNIFYSAPYAFEVKYKERPDDPTDEFFQVDLTQDTANHTDWVNFATGDYVKKRSGKY